LKFFHTLALFACVFATSSLSLLTARAQDRSTTSSSEPALASPVTTGSDTTEDANRTRQVRALAYSKLLAGQRLLLKVRYSENEAADAATTIQAAQKLFLEASQLDPTMAEAHTALAEISFFYPPRNVEEAARLANVAIKINNNNFGGHQMLSRIYGLRSGLNGQQLDKTYAERTIVELKEVTRLAPNNAEAWALLGEMLMALDRKDEAIAAFTKWAAAPPAAHGMDARFFQTITGGGELTPDSAAARLGDALIRAGRPREAVASIRRAISLDPQNAGYQELLGRAIESGGSDDASIIKELRALAVSDPQSVPITTQLARVLARSKQVDDAVQTLRAAIAIRPATDKEGLAKLRYVLAQTYSDASRNAEAIAVYEDMLKGVGVTGNSPITKEPEKAMAGEFLRRILALYKTAEKSTEAIQTIDRMRKVLGDDDPAIELDNVNLLSDLGQRREALTAVRAARVRFPQQREFAYVEAQILADLGQVDEGVTQLRSRLSSASQPPTPGSSKLLDFEIYLRIAGLYTQAQRAPEAVEAARQALESAPADRQDMIDGALITLSSAQERAGDLKGSEESLRRVLEKDPDNATALNNLGYFLIERNERLPEALQMIQRAVKAEPANASFLDSLGWAYFKIGNLEEAERQLADAARRNATSATIHEHLGDVYKAQGKQKEARAAWEKALKLAPQGEQGKRIKSKLSGSRK
jgi:tetratricopeptide (TPR) repeat protein